ncbi:MAG: hypothetical protein IT459_15255 [Planctomycetes bacterium]|nr:hypothetical protein [Planctomycetota bacterium]
MVDATGKDDPLARLGPDLLPDDVARPHRPRGLGSALPLAVLGLAFALIAFHGGFAEWVDTQFGLMRCYAAGLALLFVFVLGLFRAQARLRERLLDLMEEVLKLYYGPNFRREREAVDILVRALDSEQETVRTVAMGHLQRLTGQAFDDARAWRDWWADHRSSFSSMRKEAKS